MFHPMPHKDLAHPGACLIPAVEPSEDFTLADHFSIFVLTPLSAAAREWSEAHLPQNWGAVSTAIESRFVGAILRGLTDEGLTVSQA